MLHEAQRMCKSILRLYPLYQPLYKLLFYKYLSPNMPFKGLLSLFRLVSEICVYISVVRVPLCLNDLCT